ncbi:MAG: lysophospholipid acyltransferase family protein [Patescibacteria group bacterium]
MHKLIIATLVRWRIKIINPDNLPTGRPFIIVGNHQSFLDPIASWYAVAEMLDRRTYFIAKRFLKRVFGSLGDWLGMLYLGKQSDKASILRVAEKYFQRGNCIGIFPEGTRNRPDNKDLLKGKTGAARLALATGAPVVPTGIIAPPGWTARQAIYNYFFTRRTYSITIGQPLTFSKKKPEEITYSLLKETTRTIMKAVGELCNKNYPY